VGLGLGLAMGMFVGAPGKTEGMGEGSIVGTPDVGENEGVAVGRVDGGVVCTVTAPKGAMTTSWPEHVALPSQPSIICTI